MEEKLLRVIEKGEDTELTKNLHSSEIDCKCDNEDCNWTFYSIETVGAFQKLREEIDLPIIVTSGYRCVHHNENLRTLGFQTSKKSRHMAGLALDLRFPVGMDAWDFVDKCQKHFDVALDKGSFVHCHMNP